MRVTTADLSAGAYEKLSLAAASRGVTVGEFAAVALVHLLSWFDANDPTLAAMFLRSDLDHMDEIDLESA